MFYQGRRRVAASFAAEHVEGAVCRQRYRRLCRQAVADIRQRLLEAGRDPRKVLVFTSRQICGAKRKPTPRGLGLARTNTSFAQLRRALAPIPRLTDGPVSADQVPRHIHLNGSNGGESGFFLALIRLAHPDVVRRARLVSVAGGFRARRSSSGASWLTGSLTC